MFHIRRCLLVAVCTLLAPGAARAQAGYTAQVIVKAGDQAGTVLLPTGRDFLEVVGLNDSGEIFFYDDDQSVVNGKTIPKWSLTDYSKGQYTTILRAGDAVEGIPINAIQWVEGPSNDGQTMIVGQSDSLPGGHVLLTYAAGKLWLVAAPGKPAPGGQWSPQFHLPPYLLPGTPPLRMTGAGEIVFPAQWIPTGGSASGGTFRWDPLAHQVVPAIPPGLVTANGPTILFGGRTTAVTNDHGEIFFDGTVRNAAGQVQLGLYLLDAGGNLHLVAALKQALPDGATFDYWGELPADLNDNGDVAFSVQRNDGKEAYYLWQESTGQIAGPIVVEGEQLDGVGTVALLNSFYLDALAPSGFFQVVLQDPKFPQAQYTAASAHAIYRFTPLDASGTQGPEAAAGPQPSVRYAIAKVVVSDSGTGTGKKTRGVTPPSPTVRKSKNDWQQTITDDQNQINKDEAEIEKLREALQGDERQDQGNSARLDELYLLKERIKREGFDDPNSLDYQELLSEISILADEVAAVEARRNSDIARLQAAEENLDADKAKLAKDQANCPNMGMQTNLLLDRLVGGDTVADQMGESAQLSLLLKSGMNTDVGPIQSVGVSAPHSAGAGLNSLGQVALTVTIGATPSTAREEVLLLTPTTSAPVAPAP